MNNKQIAHLWANKSRESASGSHFFFRGDTIFSYGDHFPIARHYKGVVLFTDKKYSISTTRHCSYVRQACNHLTSFTVTDVMSNPSGRDVRNYAAKVESSATYLARKREMAEWDLTSHQDLVNEANSFCERFGFKTRFSMPNEKTLATLKERARIAAAKKAKATAARNARIERENAETVAKWLAGERVSIPYNYGKVHLRVKLAHRDDGQDIDVADQMETSRGATVPLADAEKAFRFVMLKRATGWRRNGEQFPIGEFHLDAVNEQGVIAGCHRVAWDEIERFAKLQGWI